MPRPAYIGLHAAAAAAFMYALQAFVLDQTTENGLLWAAMFGAGAGALAWHQTNR